VWHDRVCRFVTSATASQVYVMDVGFIYDLFQVRTLRMPCMLS
jgi:hypothetical protein